MLAHLKRGGGGLNKLEPGSYRPVNLLSPISKLIEKVWTLQINLFLKENKIVDNNNQGSIKGRNGALLIHELHHNLTLIKKERETGALISLDQSAAYDVIPHQIMKRKLSHIGLTDKSVSLIMDYLENRKQTVIINTQCSDVLLTGDNSVGQGSVSSGLLYIIYTLDMAHQSHSLRHENHSEYIKCRNHLISTYVDDCFSIIRTKQNKSRHWSDPRPV